MSEDIKRITDKIIAFRDERNWKQFHNPKDLALSLMLEAAEVVEHFQWKNEAEMAEHAHNHKSDVGEELADVFYCVLLLAHDLDIDIVEAFHKKMEKNAAKYPVEKARGSHKKYNQL